MQFGLAATQSAPTPSPATTPAGSSAEPSGDVDRFGDGDIEAHGSKLSGTRESANDAAGSAGLLLTKRLARYGLYLNQSDQPTRRGAEAMAHEGLHENEEKLAPATIDSHRAILSLMEEFEAVDWYHQRADACNDAELREILLHNMHEEMEHAAMILEWLRRHTPKLDEILRVYLFSQGDITQAEKKATGKDGGGAAGQGGTLAPRLTIGSMKGE